MKLKSYAQHFALTFLIGTMVFSNAFAQTPTEEEHGLSIDPKPTDISNVQMGPTANGEKPKVELVFCLDATGSMAGLIGTAKEKIWSIVTEISNAQSTPDIKLGMVFYRDKGDAFVTRKYTLTDDIDGIYAHLLDIQAQGGGDSPESLNQALYEAVTQMGWSPESNVYKTIFVVGDCPPHMDYAEVQYPESCKIAREKGIVLNAIKLGNGCMDAVPHFRAISQCSGGEYKQLDQNAKDVIVKTPYDEEINKHSRTIDQSKMYYGSRYQKQQMYNRKEKSLEFYNKASSTSTSQRAAYNSSSAGTKNMWGSNELINDVMNGTTKLEDLEKEQLPPEIQEMNLQEQKDYINKQIDMRISSMVELEELNKKRASFIKSEMEKNKDKSSFSGELFSTMRKQAAAKGVVLSSE